MKFDLAVSAALHHDGVIELDQHPLLQLSQVRQRVVRRHLVRISDCDQSVHVSHPPCCLCGDLPRAARPYLDPRGASVGGAPGDAVAHGR